MMQPADLSAWKELVFWVRGGGAKFYVILFLVSSGERPHIQTFAAKPDEPARMPTNQWPECVLSRCFTAT